MNANVLTLVAFLITTGCTTGNCRQIANERIKAQENPPPPAVAVPNASAGGSAATGRATKGATDKAKAEVGAKKTTTSRPAGETVVVYKYDGSLQCGMGKAIPVRDMEHELSGIPVLERENKPDGMMHIQVCGQPTGMVNAYVIPLVKLPDAERRGFRRWNFD